MESYATGPMTRNSHLARSFTLLELLVVIAVIAILASIAYPVYTGVQERAKITKDMSNLRQIGTATQLYMNDNDGVLFSTSTPWMLQLNPKYLSAWGSLHSPFDTRSASEVGPSPTPGSPVSYGINFNSIGISADTISKPTAFILFAPAQESGPTVSFLGMASEPAPGVWVRGDSGGQATSQPGGTVTAPGGTQNNRTRINALFGDLHVESMVWTTFANNTADDPNDPDATYRWVPGGATPAPPPPLPP